MTPPTVTSPAPTGTARPRRPATTAVVALALLTTSVLAAACTRDPVTAQGSPTSGTSTPTTVDRDPSWLFTLTADRALSDGTTITLVDPSDTAVAFTDRPQRASRALPTATVAAMWSQMFATSPPNAVLSGCGPDGEVSAAVEVTGVRPSDPPGNLVLDARPLPGQQLPATLDAAVLTVDDFSYGQCTAHFSSQQVIRYGGDAGTLYQATIATRLTADLLGTANDPIRVTADIGAPNVDGTGHASASVGTATLPTSLQPQVSTMGGYTEAVLPAPSQWAPRAGPGSQVDVAVTLNMSDPFPYTLTCQTSVTVPPA